MRAVLLFLFTALISSSAQGIIGDVSRNFGAPYSCPTGMASDGKNIYAADSKSDKIYRLDPESGKVIEEIDAPGYRIQGMTFDGKLLWLVDAEENVLLQFDPIRQTTEKTIWCPAKRPTGLAWDGQYLWLGDSRPGRLLQVSTEDGTTIKTLPSPAANPIGLAFDGKYLWVADRISDRIYMVLPASGEVILMFDAPSDYAWGLAFFDKELYCADYQADSIYVIKADDNEFETVKDPVYEKIEYTHQFRNYGPGTIFDLAIYIAVPEESPRQVLLEPLTFLSKAKHEIISDKWGQKVARFQFDEVKAGEMAEASFKTAIRLYDHWYLIKPEKVGSLKDIPKDIKEKYLVNDTKFAMDSEAIQNAVRKAIGDESNPYWIMRNIFNYIINNMYYELVGGWNIASTVLERGSGSCSEYSFIFISMCRAAGLPARYAGSIAQRGDLASEDEIFHRWCEVYLPKVGWFPIDPSGGDRDTPEKQALYIGHVANKYLITTTGGGGSEYLGWEYNSYEEWKSKGVCKVYSEKLGEWAPADSTKYIDVKTK
jgi:sugar lactone lactonase YvrE